jgi:hypothetical protein
LFVVVFNWSKQPQQTNLLFCLLQLKTTTNTCTLLLAPVEDHNKQMYSFACSRKRVNLFGVVLNWSKQKSKFVCCGLQLEQAKE